MKKRILIFFILTLNLTMFGQNSDLKNCYEIKYLDFFSLDQMEIIKWPQSELDGLMKMDFVKDRGQSKIKTSFIIPMIVYQLKNYHPNCNAVIDTIYFKIISDIYFKIRDIDSNKLLKKSIAEKIDFIRDDFYSQVENIEYLPKMTMTFDDGPFYGVDFDKNLKLQAIKTQETEFGTLSISKVDDKTILTSTNKNGDLIWRKSIIGLSNRNLTELHFTDNAMNYNSVGVVVNMFSEGEKLTLYLKINGSFMYYFHSW